MQTPLRITSRDFALTPAIESEIREKAEKLDRYYDGIIGCEVTVEANVNHHRKGGPFNVRIDLTVPGVELAVTHRKQEILAAAVREAFEAMKRRLEDYARQQRREVKTHDGPPHGRVIKLFRELGYGFIEAADGREVYFHRNSVLEPGFDHLEIGTEVRFAEETGIEGPQASTVTITYKAPGPKGGLSAS